MVMMQDTLGKVSKKKSCKKSGDSANRDGVTPNQTLFLKKKSFFQGPHRTILGHPKHVLHLVRSACGSP